MKNYILVLSAMCVLGSLSAMTLESDREAAIGSISRVVKVIPLVSKDHIQVSVAIRDIGGSTDSAPTQEAFFTLYSKGEISSTDASFNLGPIYNLKSAKRISGGIYEVSIVTDKEGKKVDRTLKINAIKAIQEITQLKCETFDCDESSQFKTKIQIN
jgi:hypothetical protein